VEERYACRAVVVPGIFEIFEGVEEDEEDEGASVLAWSCGDDDGGEGVGE